MKRGMLVRVEWKDGTVEMGRLLEMDDGGFPCHVRITTCRGGQMAGIAVRVEALAMMPEAAE